MLLPYMKSLNCQDTFALKSRIKNELSEVWITCNIGDY